MKEVMGSETEHDGGWVADAGRPEWADRLVVVERTEEPGVTTTTLFVDRRLFYAPALVVLAVCVVALAIALAVRRRRSK
jgi:hypothetical protein